MKRESLCLLVTVLALSCAAGCSSGKKGSREAATAQTAGTTGAGATTSSTTPTTPAPGGTTPAPGGTTPPPGGTTPPPGGTTPPPPTTGVGSPYWYQGDAFGNPYKTHNANEASFAQRVFSLVNQERAAAGVHPLQYDLEAELAAKVHVEDMEGRGYFSHFTPEGWSPLDRLNMTGATGFSLNAENIAIGQQDPASVMRAWMTSAGHRANILHADYTHIGVGVDEARPYWAQVFLRRP